MNSENGDIILAYTDGVTDAHNKQDGMYSEERLIQYTIDHPVYSASDFLTDLYKEVTLFEDGAEPLDDVTMLCLRCLKSQE